MPVSRNKFKFNSSRLKATKLILIWIILLDFLLYTDYFARCTGVLETGQAKLYLCKMLSKCFHFEGTRHFTVLDFVCLIG